VHESQRRLFLNDSRSVKRLLSSHTFGFSINVEQIDSSFLGMVATSSFFVWAAVHDLSITVFITQRLLPWSENSRIFIGTWLWGSWPWNDPYWLF